MMKRTIKFSLGILALVVVALLVAPLFINVESYKPRIATAIEKATGRHVEIGEIHASLFPWIGVSLKNVSLANRQGFSSRPFASIGDLDIKVALLPLFSKRIEIKRFEVDGFSVSLERNAAGEGNWQGLGSGTGQAQAAAEGQAAAAAPEKAASGTPMQALAALTAESIHLQNGRLLWADAQSGTQVELTDLDLQVDDVSLDQPFGFNLSGKAAGGSFSVDGKVGPIGSLASFDVAHLPVQLHVKSEQMSLQPFKSLLASWPSQLGAPDQASLGMDAQFEQRPDGVRVTTGGAKLAAAYALAAQWKAEMPDLESVKLEQVQLAVDGKDALDASGSISKLSQGPSYQFTLNSGTLTRAWLSGFLPALNDMYAGNPSPWQSIKFGAIVTGDTRGMDVRDLKLMLDNDLVQASGTVTFGKAPSILLRIAANDLHADPWLPQPKQAAAQPAATPTAPVQGAGATPVQGAAAKATEPDLRFLVPWDINAQMQIERLLLKGLSFDHLRARLVAHGGTFDLNPFRFELSGGQVSEHAVLNVRAYPAQWSESARLSGVQIGPVLKALAGTDMLEGTLQMESDTKATGLLPDHAMRSLNGRGHVLLTDGMVRGFNIAAAMRSLGGPASNAPQSTDFSQLSGSYVLVNGVAKNDDLFLASPLLRLTGKGKVDLVNKTLDYHVKPTLVGTLVGQGDTVTARKGLSVPLAISGSFSQPKVRPDINAGTVIENLKKGGGLGGLLQGAQPQQPPSGNTQKPKAAPTPQQQLKKAIEGLVPRF
jgi:AsmA protein